MKKTAKCCKATASKSVAPKAQATVFKLFSPHANRVSVSGNFNNWDAAGLSAKKDAKGNWSVTVSLKPGRYEYKFIVDGSWITDPSTTAVTNGFGSQNSVVEVK